MLREMNPALQLQAFQAGILTSGETAFIDFRGSLGSPGDFHLRSGNTSIVLEPDSPLRSLAEIMIVAEIGEEWSAGGGTSGYFRFDPDGSIWLDAESDVLDWSFERAFDPEDLLDCDWAASGIAACEGAAHEI